MKTLGWAPEDIYIGVRGTQKILNIKQKGAYLSRDLRQKFSDNPDLFFLELNLLDENIKLIERFFTKVLDHGDDLNSRKALVKFIKLNLGLSAWGYTSSWGREEILDIDDIVEDQLLKLGEDVYYRSLLMGALGVILSSLYGCRDIDFLKSLYHLPLVVDFLFLIIQIIVMII